MPSQGLEFEAPLFDTLPTRELDLYDTLMTDLKMLKIPAGYASDKTILKHSSPKTTMSGTFAFLFQSYMMVHPGHNC